MKTIICSFAVLLSATMFAQTMDVAETDKQIKRGDSLVKHGTEMVSEFMVMRDTATHSHAVRDFAAAKAIYDNCMANGTVPDNDWGMTKAMILDGKLSLVGSYMSLYGTDYRNELMAEPEKERSKKVTYKGTEYKVSKKTKEHFDLLNPKK